MKKIIFCLSLIFCLFLNTNSISAQTNIDECLFKVKKGLPSYKERAYFDLENYQVKSNDNLISNYNIIDNQIKIDSFYSQKVIDDNLLKLELPIIYFDYPLNDNYQEFSLFLMFLMVIINIIIYLAFGKEQSIKRLVKPHYNLEYSSAMIGFLVNEKLSIRDLSSLIGYWACRGYLKIIYHSEIKQSLLVKQKDLDSKIQYENELFKMIFNNNSKISINDLPKEFFKLNMKTQKKYQKNFNSIIGLYDKRSLIIKYLFLFINTFVFSLIISIIPYEKTPNALYVFGLVFIFLLILDLLQSYLIQNYKILNKYINVLILVLIILGYLAFSISLVLTIAGLDFSMKIMLINLALYLISVFVISSILKRTKKNHHLYEEVLGLRNFIASSNSIKIKENLKEDINYYEILIYAYVLNTADIYLDKLNNTSNAVIDTFENESQNKLESFYNLIEYLNHDEKTNKFNRF